MVDRYVQFTLSISMINRFIQKIEKQAKKAGSHKDIKLNPRENAH